MDTGFKKVLIGMAAAAFGVVLVGAGDTADATEVAEAAYDVAGEASCGDGTCGSDDDDGEASCGDGTCGSDDDDELV